MLSNHRALISRSVKASGLRLDCLPHQFSYYIIGGCGRLNPLDMPHTAQGFSSTTTVLLCLVLSISLFPNLFHYLWTLPLGLLTIFQPAALVSPVITSPTPTTTLEATTMSWFQKQFTLPANSRGSYLITDQVVSALPEIRSYKVGLLNLFVQHTSCALSLNENCKLIERRPC